MLGIRSIPFPCPNSALGRRGKLFISQMRRRAGRFRLHGNLHGREDALEMDLTYIGWCDAASLLQRATYEANTLSQPV